VDRFLIKYNRVVQGRLDEECPRPRKINFAHFIVFSPRTCTVDISIKYFHATGLTQLPGTSNLLIWIYRSRNAQFALRCQKATET